MKECVNCGEECEDDDEYCEYCLEHMCTSCGCITDDLDDDGVCYECRRNAWIDTCEGYYDR